MQLSDGSHLSYCSNIHPGESWGELASQLRQHVPNIKASVCPNAPFGLGLRLSAEAAAELQSEAGASDLESLLDELHAYLFTINGFPYGRFHGERIKEKAYEPDWTTDARVQYTLELATTLSRLADRHRSTSTYASISTVPGCFRSVANQSVRANVAYNLARTALALRKLEDQTGTRVVLGLEPEPACMLETTDEIVSFMENELLGRSARNSWPDLPGAANEDIEPVLRRYLGVCLDTCHAAVQFEDPKASVTRLRQSGLCVAKVQVTTALSLPRANEEALAQLKQFDDGQYLHQGSVRLDDSVVRFVDLPQALANPSFADRPWRVHFHVPVFMKTLGVLQNTQDDLAKILAEHRREPLSEHLEVETYTFGVLPEEFRPKTVTEAICREIEWTKSQLHP